MAENDRQKRGRKLLLTLLIVGVVGSIAGIGTFSAFTATTDNTGNYFTAGTVSITDNDAGAALYAIPDGGPGTSSTSCINVKYTGSLPATVALTESGALGSIAGSLNLTIEQGSPVAAFGTGCSGFGTGTSVYSGTLAGFTGASLSGTWNQNDERAYRFTIAMPSGVTNNALQGQSTGLHSFVWTATNS
jgi:predicted ribosomally synthesized peptide with SipW-like signal peptide